MEGNSLECFICFNNYDLGKHLPRILPLCGHTICENCLSDILKTAEPKCPLDTVLFASKNLSSFPQNYALKGMIQSRPKPKENQNGSNEGKVNKTKKIQELKALVDKIDELTQKANQELDSRQKLTKKVIESHFEELRKALEEKRTTIIDKLDNLFIQEKARLRSDLEGYEFQKMDILNMMKDSENSNNNNEELMSIDVYMITANLAEAEKNIESLYASHLSELDTHFSNDFSEISGRLSKLDIINSSKQHQFSSATIEAKSHAKNNQGDVQAHAPSSDLTHQILVIPNYSNSAVLKTEETSGPYIYDGDQDEDKDLPFLPPYQFVENNAVYKGQWKNGMRHGRGEQYWTDGSRYAGYWRNNMANGRGRLIHADGDVYDGEWVNDKAHGHGIYSHADGARYEGAWYEDKQHGKGLETWSDGARYQGDYVLGKKQGQGVFKWADGSIYNGGFNNNVICGHGLYEWADGRKYDGGWKDGDMHGHGVYSWSDGRKYIGNYLNGKKDGYGEFEWPDGRKYKGEWKDGRQHGKGTYITATAAGGAREGEWADGARIRWI